MDLLTAPSRGDRTTTALGARRHAALARVVASIALVSLVSLAGCDRREAEPPARTTVAYGTYRAVLKVPGGDLPFGLELAQENGKPVAFLLNGAERVRVDDATVAGTHLELKMPGYGNTIVADATPQGLSGDAVMLRRHGQRVQIPFVATFGRTERFPEGAAPSPAGVGGRWAVTFTSRDGAIEPAVAEFQQDGAKVSGTFLTPTGDHRFLEGRLSGDELLLSRFDGGSAFLYRARLTPEGTLSGNWWSGSWSVTDWTATRDENATLGENAPASTLKNPDALLAFTFPDLDGKPVSLDDRRFAGKVVIVSLGGSWCPNCHDEAKFLQPYYRDLKAQGLEVVYLQFEHFDTFAEAVAENRRFVKQFGIEWPVLIAGISDKDDVLTKLPQLEKMVAYPTALFVDRKGKVRRIHTGFSGPATGAHYEEWRQEFETLVKQLLSERA
jgi:thiol-disulfide isomerase/thioredoxin